MCARLSLSNVFTLGSVTVLDVRTQLAMILYLDRSRPAMIYPLDRSWLGHTLKIYRIDNVLDIPRLI